MHTTTGGMHAGMSKSKTEEKSVAKKLALKYYSVNLNSVLKISLLLLTDIISSFLHCWDRSLMPLTKSLLALT